MADYMDWSTEEIIQNVEKEAYKNGQIMGAFKFFSVEVLLVIFSMLFYLATNYG